MPYFDNIYLRVAYNITYIDFLSFFDSLLAQIEKETPKQHSQNIKVVLYHPGKISN